MEKLGCWAIFEACFCTRYEKEKKKGYFSCKDFERCDNQKKFFDVFEAQHEQNEGYESD